jgi:hypothetical protein
MRWKGILAGIGIVLVTVTACGQRPPTVGPAEAPSASVPAVPSMPNRPGSSQALPAGSTVVPPAKLDVSNLPTDYPREVYVTADGKSLYLRAQEGGCGRAAAQVRTETAQAVVVDLLETQSNLRGQMCTMDIRYPLVSVPLAEPLGQRQVILFSRKR